MANLPPKILVVDADPTVTGPISDPLDKMGIEVFAASDLQTAMYRFNKQFFRVIFVELKFPELDGLSVIQKWRNHEIAEKQTAGFIVMTSAPLSKEQLALVNEMGKIQVVQKPLQVGPMITQIQRAYKLHVRYELALKIKKDITEKLEKDGDLKAAIKSVQEFKEPLSDEYYPLLLELYQLHDNYEEGIEVLRQIPNEKMDPLQRLNLMGKFNLKMGNLEDARKFYEEADQVAPKNMERITDMVDMYLQLKSPDKAVDKQRQILDLNPENRDIKFDLFKQLEDNGFADHAASFCQETSAPKEVVRYFNNKGVVMAQTDSIDVAIEEYKRAITYYPNNKDNYLIHFNIALAFLRKRDPKFLPQAKEHLSACLKLQPNFEKAKALLNKILDRQAG
ncbi:response regulator [Pseudobacteriovorax antillogorgiicola]|uniref:Tetratricopeptide repeat-containing protein n=1 Tax=Pseudobacteriovorax antillogorgiicola TaxID=1513793 RepID=A0A1Y6BKC0_9BACT|nr:response regulator [Pseudobacteriovorax antillogorgiicola]TCS56312.1 tetratricopeptide repeat protein [Pseudobacteriovorax antillogorgiicola]SMF07198.1 Tetratricopeptide repeat-containing protein [Pseudobacteriovorax antillogorgiicola]